MRKTLQVLALLLLVGGTAFWVARGAHRGWTKTTVAIRTFDPITELEGIEYQNRFIPGIDFMSGVLVGVGLLTGTSFIFRKSSIPSTHS